MDKLSRIYGIPCHMVDSTYRLRPASFMDIAQEMAMEGSRELGFGYDRLSLEHKAWVLYRMQFTFIRPVLWKEEVTVSTWHKGVDGVLYLRECEMLDARGERAVAATSSWIVMDTSERAFVRPEDLPEYVNPAPQCTEALFASPAAKVVMPRGEAPVLLPDHIVTWSDVDFVGHTNNAKYVAWAMDALDAQFVSEHPVREVAVNFNHETHLGDVVQMRMCRQGDTFYVDGSVGGRQAFAVKITF